MSNRRAFIYQLAAAGLAFSFSSCRTGGKNTKNSFNHYIPLAIEDDTKLNTPTPEGKRSPFGWNYFEIPKNGDSVPFGVPDLPDDFALPIYLRLFVALEVRDQLEITVTLGKSDKIIGVLPIWYANVVQLFECKLDIDSHTLRNEGLTLRLSSGSESLYCYDFSAEVGSHIYLDKGKAAEPAENFIASLCSLQSVNTFGWMEGCVTDGLDEMARSGVFPQAENVLDRHLRLFIPDENNIIYEDYHGHPKDNIFNNWEGGLPFAAIVNKFPDHPSIKLFTDFCENRIENNKTKGSSLTTEGCYHLAYPLAAVAKAKGKKEWFEIALIELDERIHYLTGNDVVYQRASKNGEQTAFRNWARGYAWFLLGLVRSYPLIDKSGLFKGDSRLTRIKQAFEEYAHVAIKYQQPDAGWKAYIDLIETGFDASGTAGIASALMYGYGLGWNVDFNEQKQLAARERLEQSLTSDGFLKDNCQVNRGGEELQKGNYRVISQYAMGLMAHLYI